MNSSSTGGPAARQTGEPLPTDVVPVDFPNCLAREFPEEFPLAWRAVEATLQLTSSADLSGLARRSPGLRGFDWSAYLRCSTARMVRALSALRRLVEPGARVLDCGAYFGNFSLMLAAAGYQVDASDTYGEYGVAFEGVTKALERAGVRVIDTSRPDRSAARPLTYDAVLSMGVVEHVPHTPRLFLEMLDGLVRSGGTLVLDTPNLGYLYTRQKLSRGESIFCPIALQYYTELPFEGHHREYTVDEVRWLLGEIGHEEVRVETFNYSFYGLTQLAGTDLANHRRMIEDPSLREVILATSRKPFRSP